MSLKTPHTEVEKFWYGVFFFQLFLLVYEHHFVQVLLQRLINDERLYVPLPLINPFMVPAARLDRQRKYDVHRLRRLRIVILA